MAKSKTLKTESPEFPLKKVREIMVNTGEIIQIKLSRDKDDILSTIYGSVWMDGKEYGFNSELEERVG